MTELIYKDEVYEIVGAAMEVHKELGCGFLEAVYQEGFLIELREKKMPFESQKRLPIYYKGKRLKKEYYADVVCYGKIIVELKTLDKLTSKEESQVLNYLKASGLKVGVLINFGAASLEWKRFVF
ncbi:MAG: GxxExxY protein [Deltaproteobacteria bacterium]|nr:GxxExxY protein [Deltaproteobacteria bacterium]